MKKSDGIVEICDKCGATKRVENPVYQCDLCGTEISDQYPVNATLFYNKSRGRTDPDEVEFCSWDCCLEYLSMLSFDGFIGLCTIHYDDSEPAKNAAAFWKAVNDFQT